MSLYGHSKASCGIQFSQYLLRVHRKPGGHCTGLLEYEYMQDNLNPHPDRAYILVIKHYIP